MPAIGNSPPAAMSSSTVLPPLRLRPFPSLSSASSPSATAAGSPASSASSSEEDAKDRERRAATAVTIVELFARAGPQAAAKQTEPQHQLQGQHRASPPLVAVAPRPVLPSLPKMKVSPSRPAGPAARGDQWLLGAHSSFFGMMAAHSAAEQVAGPNGGAPAVPPPAPAVNNSRKRQKDELTRLRAQVQELQRELEHVRGRLPHKQASLCARPAGLSVKPAASPTTTDTASEQGVVSVPVWERMAQHQKEEKSKAEMENLRLKGLIQEQMKISKGLEKLLKKRCKAAGESPFPDKRQRVGDAGEAALYDSLVASIDARVHELSAVFEKSGLARDKRELQETQMILDERRGPVMEVKDARILPFDVATCSSALWRCIEQEAYQDHDICRDQCSLTSSTFYPVKPTYSPRAAASADTICIKGVLPLRQYRAPDAELDIRGVLKRFESGERVVFLWESVAECPNKVLNYAAKDAEVRDFGWGVIEALPTAPGEHSSIVQLCSYIAPRVSGGSLAEECRQHVHSLADLVVPCYRDLWGKRQRAIENLLMDVAVGKRSLLPTTPTTPSTSSVKLEPVE